MYHRTTPVYRFIPPASGHYARESFDCGLHHINCAYIRNRTTDLYKNMDIQQLLEEGLQREQIALDKLKAKVLRDEYVLFKDYHQTRLKRLDEQWKQFKSCLDKAIQNAKAYKAALKVWNNPGPIKGKFNRINEILDPVYDNDTDSHVSETDSENLQDANCPGCNESDEGYNSEVAAYF